MSDPRYVNIGHPIVRAIEECAELTKELCKIQRFGPHDWNPNDPKKVTNLVRARRELEDVRDTLAVLEEWLDRQEQDDREATY